MKESAIIELFKTKFSSDSIIGIGDDCAVLPGVLENQFTVVTTDMLIEGSHFLRDQISVGDLARKSLAVNLSDIAAMGAKPSYVFLSIAFPKELSDQWIQEFSKAFTDECLKYDVILAGGDTNQSPGLIVINLTVHGTVEKKNLKLRSGAKPGDLICVAGSVGDSRAGLQCLRTGHFNSATAKSLIKKHFEVTPQLAQGLYLGQQAGVTAMMDVSDGLIADLPKLVKASGCQAQITLEQIPISQTLRSYEVSIRNNIYEFAALGGEDYVLLFTVNENYYQTLKEDFKKELGHEFSCIGKMTIGLNSSVQYLLNGNNFVMKTEGFEHF